MSSRVFLQSLQQKLKGGNARSIHLNALPGRFATRLDLKNLEIIRHDLPDEFLHTLLSKPNFGFPISLDPIDLNEASGEDKKLLGMLSKRLNSLVIENDDLYKEHGMKTLGFGYPILVRRSTRDPLKVIKAPLFIWPLDAVKSGSKVGEWTLLRNKSLQDSGKLADADLHSVSLNEVLLSFIKGEDGITLPGLPEDALEDGFISQEELLAACAAILNALSPGSRKTDLETLTRNFSNPVNALPEAGQIDPIANAGAYIHFGGVFGLFRAQKESIITDISRLLDRFDEFQFDDLVVENLSVTPFSAVDTDPSQQAIIGALGVEANQVIQGPPGTGKSQSLTALITNALANNLKCLVVCEKKTALDVIKRNLARHHEKLGALAAVIDDVTDDREIIVDSVRERQLENPFSVTSPQAALQYESAMRSIAAAAEAVNSQHAALEKPIYRGRTWTDLVGRYLELCRLFGEVPLKTVLETSAFQFQNDEQELDDTSIALDKAESLFKASAHLHRTFNILHDRLFSGPTVGESRLKIESFMTTARREIPLTEAFIRDEMKYAQAWSDEQFPHLPGAVQDSFNPYLPFFVDSASIINTLPLHLPIELTIDSLLGALREIDQQAKQFLELYRDRLTEHYASYHLEVTESIKSYLGFADQNIATYGPAFCKNNGLARFMTSLLGIFSSRYKQLRANRLALRSGIAHIRQIHLRRTYFEHHYNDELEVTDLTIYISNIRELYSQATSRASGYPDDIAGWLNKAGEDHFHPDLLELKPVALSILEAFNDLVLQIQDIFDLSGNYSVHDLSSLIHHVTPLAEELLALRNVCLLIRQEFGKRVEHNREIQRMFAQLEETDNGETIFRTGLVSYNSLQDALEACEAVNQTVLAFAQDMPEFRAFYDWQHFALKLPALHRSVAGIISVHQGSKWALAFECWYLFSLLTLFEPDDLPRNEYELERFSQHKKRFNDAQLNNIIASWSERQRQSMRLFKEKGMVINSLFNKKGSKGMRRNSLRTIINREFELFTDFFPVLLLNPSVCSSILPLQEGLFDVVIFDEASQLRLEDTYAALVRGKAKIVSGDRHQMAPSSYFESGGAVLEPADDEEELPEENWEERGVLHDAQRSLADSESLLAYAEDKGFRQRHLDIHYRSRHPYLIDFSNHAFYGSRLIPVPDKHHYKPIQFIRVDGVYENQCNMEEALQVVSLLRNNIKSFANGTYPSVGVATFNIYQRNLILEEIDRQRRNDPVFNKLMSDLGDSFFVKNLENIQGDERDVIILSTTFGKKQNGSFSQNFGPIIQQKGHRMLNVIITRAKYKIFVCTSFPMDYIGQYTDLLRKNRNRGRGVLYAYLMYAKAVSEGDDTMRESILKELTLHCAERQYDGFEPGPTIQSPFEEEVYTRLAAVAGKERIVRNYKVGGFRIDIVICSKLTGKPIIAIECDGSKYHNSPQAYGWDIFRQQKLKQYGFAFYRTWSSKWWDAPEKETARLVQYIHELDSAEQAESITRPANLS